MPREIVYHSVDPQARFLDEACDRGGLPHRHFHDQLAIAHKMFRRAHRDSSQDVEASSSLALIATRGS